MYYSDDPHQLRGMLHNAEMRADEADGDSMLARARANQAMASSAAANLRAANSAAAARRNAEYAEELEGRIDELGDQVSKAEKVAVKQTRALLESKATEFSLDWRMKLMAKEMRAGMPYDSLLKRLDDESATAYWRYIERFSVDLFTQLADDLGLEDSARKSLLAVAEYNRQFAVCGGRHGMPVAAATAWCKRWIELYKQSKDSSKGAAYCHGARVKMSEMESARDTTPPTLRPPVHATPDVASASTPAPGNDAVAARAQPKP